jgi:hypothetical protein
VTTEGWAEKLRNLTTQLQLLTVIFNEFAAWSYNNGNVLGGLSDVGKKLSDVTKAIMDSVEAMAALAEWKGIEDVPGKLRGVMDALLQTVQAMAGFSGMQAVTDAAAIAAPLTGAVQAMADVAGAMAEIAGSWETVSKFKWSDMSIELVLRWLAAFGALATQAAAGAASWAAGGLDSLKAFGETVRAALGGLVDAARAWETIQKFKWSDMSVEPVLRWLAAFGAMATQAAAGAASWAAKGGDDLKAFGEAVRSSVGALTDAARAWETISKFEWGDLSVEPVLRWLASLGALATKAVAWAAEWGSSNEGIKPFAEAMREAFGALSSAISFLEDLRMWKGSADLADQFVKFRKLWEFIVEEFARTRRDVRLMVDDELREFAQGLGDIAQGLSRAVELLMVEMSKVQIPAEQVWGPFIDWLVDLFADLVRRLRAIPALASPENSELVQEFAAGIGSVMGAIRTALEAGLAMPREWTTPPDSVILPVVDWMMHVFQLFAQRLRDWFPDTADEALGWPVVQQFAQAVGSVLTAIRDAALLALELPREWATPPDSVIMPVIDWMMHVFQVFTQRLQDWFPDSAEEAKSWPVVQQFAQAVGSVLTAIRDAALLALELPREWTTPPDSVILPVIDWMMHVFQVFTRRLQEVFPDTAEEAKAWPVVQQFAQGVTAVLTAIKDAALLALQLPSTWTAPPDSVLLPVIDWMLHAFRVFQDRLLAVFPDTAAEAKNWPVVVQFAQAVGTVLSAIKDAALLALQLPSTWAPPGDEVVRAVIDWMTAVFRMFSTRLTAVFPDTAEEAKSWPVVQQFAQAVGVVMSAIKSAVDVAVAIPATWTPPSQALLDSVITFIQNVFTRLYNWINSKGTYAGKQIPFGAEGLALVQAFGGALQSLMGGLGASFDVFTGLLSFVPPAESRLIAFVDTVKTTIATVNSRIVSTLTPAATAAIQAFGSALGALMGGLSSSLNLFKDLAGTTPGTYTPGTAGADFETRIGNLMQGVSGTLTAFKTYVQQKVGSEWIPASQVFLNASQQVFGVLTQALSLFRDLATTGMPSSAQLTAFVQAVLAIFRGFATDLTAMATPIQAGGAAINTGLIAGLNSKLAGVTGSNTVEGAARAVSGLVYNIVKDNVPSLTTTKAYGEAVDQGLIDGMNNKLTGVSQMATTLGREIRLKLESELQIGSPSAVATDIGAFWGQGLVNGMEGQLGAVRQAALGLAGAMGLNGPQMAFAGVPQQTMLIRHEVAVTSPDGSVNQIDINRLADRLAPVMRDGIRSRRW